MTEGGSRERGRGKEAKNLINYKHIIINLPHLTLWQPEPRLFPELDVPSLLRAAFKSRVGLKKCRDGFKGHTNPPCKCHLSHRSSSLRHQETQFLPISPVNVSGWSPELRVGHELSAAASFFLPLVLHIVK